MAPGFHRLRSSVAALAATAAGLLALMGCSSDSSTAVGVTHPTMIEVAPQDFLGELTCSSEASSVRRYVATLFDVTEEGAGGAGGDDDEPRMMDADGVPVCGGFQLPSSEPTPCLASVGFGFVVSGRRYCAEVDAYDTDQIEPRGTGTRLMVASDPEDGVAAPLVQRRWHTFCEGATAAPATIVRAGGCLPLLPLPDATALASVRVETDALLGDLECGNAPGQVDRFNVRTQLEGEDFGRNKTPFCGVEDALFTELPPGISLSFDVAAFTQGSQAIFAGATCRALTVPGTTVVAECTPLSQLGTLRVDLETALQAIGFGCDESVSDVRVTVDGVSKSLPPPDCLEPFDHGFLPDPVNEASVIVDVFHGDVAGPLRRLVCHGAVQPGKLVVAQCDCPMCPAEQ